jgi:PAS domain S-box-containing protein
MSVQPLTPPPAIRSHRKIRRYRLAAIGLLIIGIGFSIVLWHFTRQTVHNTEKGRFDHYSEMIRGMLGERIDEHVSALRGMRAFINASERVTRTEWQRYVSDLDVDRHFAGALGFSFIRYVRRDGLGAFLTATRADDAPDFQVNTSGAHPDLGIIEFIQPLERNRSAVGYDLGQEKVRRQALFDAVDLDQVVLTSRLTLIQDKQKQPGFLLVLPVYNQGAVITTREERWRALRGWVGASIRIGNLLSGIDSYFNTPLDIEIFDDSTGNPQSPLYDADGRLRSALPAHQTDLNQQGLHSQITLEIAGRTWNLNIIALPGFTQPIEHHTPEILLAGSLLLSLFAALLVASYAKPLEQARTLAEKMTADLQASEQRFQKMFRDHNAIMLLVEPVDGRILDANTAACQFYGYTPEQLKAMLVKDISANPQEVVTAARQKVMAGEARTFEFQHRLASGDIHDVEIHSSPVEIGDQTVIFSVIHDITPRKIAQQALAENEQKYRALFDEAAHGMAVADLETGLVLACNRKLAQMVGREVDEIVGHPQAILHPSESITSGQSRSFLFHRERNPDQLVADQLQTRDGRLVAVEIKTSRLILGGRDALQGFFYDVSERHQTEKSLRESESRFRLVFESNPDPVILFRFDTGDVIDVNQAFVNATAISRLEALGHSAEQLGLWVEAMDQKHFWHQLRAEGAVNNFEAEFRAIGGLIRTGLFSARQININREPCVLATIRDITVEKTAERSLIAMDQMKNEFISTAAHELRTPLSAIMGFTELLLTPGAFGSFSEAQKHDFLSQVYERGEALSRIIDDLLDISRIESGHPITLDLQPVDLRDVLVKAFEFYRLHDKSHLFQLTLPDDDATQLLDIDRQRINQVLENLLSNAVKYSPKGCEITIEGSVQPQGWEVRVKDKGIGMTPEQVARVFDKFYRADASNTAVGGLGLGMSIAKQVIDAHGGKIWVVSSPGQGTQVGFFLPTTPD